GRTLIPYRDVQFSVAVEITQRQMERIATHAVFRCSLKGSVSATQKDTDRPQKRTVGHSQVSFSISVEVAHNRPIGKRAGRKVSRCLETAVSVAHEDGNVVRTPVGQNKVKLAITIKIVRYY